MAIEVLKKNKTMAFVNISDTETPIWARIGKSTIFDLTLNANIVTSDYIEDEGPTDNVMSYKPTLPQELRTEKGDKAFDYMYDMLYNLPTGGQLIKDVLLVFAGNIGTETTPQYNAWLTTATVILKNLNTVDEKILFDLNFGGNRKLGTVTISDGVPVFTEDTKVTL